MAVVATGFFDGVHIGHRMVIETLVTAARERGEESLIITFWPHPRIVLHSDAINLRLLNTLDEKIILLKSLGVDRVEVLPFTEEFSRLSTEEYLKGTVIGRFGGTAMLLGYDNRIGHDSGTPEQIAAIASRLGLDVITTEKVSAIGLAVSSTKIRKALLAGDVSTASIYLRYEYAIEGEVVHGRKLGRTIGFPTANLALYEPMKLVPADGVYLTRVHLGDEVFYGMTNIGNGIETHIFDFNEEIYGRCIRLEFLRRLRDEIHFNDLQELRVQLAVDEDSCRKLLVNLK